MEYSSRAPVSITCLHLTLYSVSTFTRSSVVTYRLIQWTFAYTGWPKNGTKIATHLRCGGIFSDSIITNFLLILTMK